MEAHRDHPAPTEPFLLRGDLAGAEPAILREGLTRIGRSSKNDICIRESSVSRFHCCLLREGSVVSIYDSRSSNRTRVGREEASGQVLSDGDVIRLGRCALVFRAAALEPAVPAARAPVSAGVNTGVRQRAAAARAVLAGRPAGGSLLPVTLVLALSGVVAGLLIWNGFSIIGGWPPADIPLAEPEARRQTIAADAAVAPPVPASAPSPADADSLRELLAAQERRLAELTRRLASLERPAESAASVVTDPESSGSDDEVEARLREELERMEAEREKLAEQFRAALLGTPAVVSDRGGVGEGDEEWQTVVQLDGEEPEEDYSKLPRRVLATREVNILVGALEGVLDRYAEHGVGPRDLQPALAELSSGIGEKPAEGVLRVYRHGVDLLEELDRTIAYLRKRNEEWIRKAEAEAGEGGGTDAAGGAAGMARRNQLEEYQRRLELSAKKIKIQEDQRERLLSLQETVLDSLARFQDRDATEYLAAQFALRSDRAMRLAVLRALEAAGAKHAVPLLLPRLTQKDTELATAVHATLVKLTGEDLGLDRRRWEEWWRQQTPEGDDG